MSIKYYAHLVVLWLIFAYDWQGQSQQIKGGTAFGTNIQYCIFSCIVNTTYHEVDSFYSFNIIIVLIKLFGFYKCNCKKYWTYVL